MIMKMHWKCIGKVHIYKTLMALFQKLKVVKGLLSRSGKGREGMLMSPLKAHTHTPILGGSTL